jgi:hypothetical protein
MCGDSFGFFLVIGVLGALEPDARFCLVPPVLIRCFFGAGSGKLNSRARFLVGGCTLCDSVVGWESVTSAFVEVGQCFSVRAEEYVTRRKGWIVLFVLCVRGKKCCDVEEVSCVGFGLPSWHNASVSSSQQASPQTIASCVLMGNGGVGCKQLACHTMLHHVHSVSVPPVLHTFTLVVSIAFPIRSCGGGEAVPCN